MPQTTTIEAVKKGDFFRFPGKKSIYVRGEYNRSLKKYEYYKFEDINAFNQKKKGTLVEINFYF